MRKYYSEDIRKIAIRKLVEEKKTLEIVSKELGITARTLTNWKRDYRESGRVAPILYKDRVYKNGRNYPSRMIKNHKEFEYFVEKNGGLTMQQMAEEYEKIAKTKITKSGIRSGLKRIGFSFKKKL